MKKFKTTIRQDLVQNYTPSMMRHSLLNCDKWEYRYLEPNTVSGWEDLINEIIDNLEKGHLFNGCGEKNTVLYWKRQLDKLAELKADMQANWNPTA